MSSSKLSLCLSSLQQDENNINLLLELSEIYSDLGDLEQAQSYLARAQLLDPILCLNAQGILNLKQGELDKAQEHFLEALKYQQSADIYYNLAFSYYLNNDLEQALASLAQIDAKEQFGDVLLLKARILQQQNELEPAITLLESQLEQSPEHAETLSFLALLHFDNNNYDQAELYCQQTLELDASLYDAQLVSIMLRLLTQECTIEEIQALLEVNPKDSRLWFALGSTYMGLGDFVAAEEYLEKTIVMHPEFYDCYISLAWCQLLNNKAEQAHETYQNAITIIDYLAEAWAGLAIIYALNSDLARTEQLIVKANSLNPECFLTEIAQVIYLAHKKPEDASPELLTILADAELSLGEKLAFIINELN